MTDLRGQWTIVERVFPSWSIELPVDFESTFVPQDGYWHAWRDDRSVSMSSQVVTEDGHPVAADRLAATFGADPLAGAFPDGRLPRGREPIPLPPCGLPGVAVWGPLPEPARATHAVSGLLAAPGRVLLVTITTDDREWALRTWRSIEYHPGMPLDPPPNRAMRRRHRR